MDAAILSYRPQLAAVIAVAVMWGDLRRQITGLTDQVTRQNGRVGKLEDAIGGDDGLRERVKALEVQQ